MPASIPAAIIPAAIINKKTIRAMFERLRADDPAPTTELQYQSLAV